ncbi:zinc finger protein 582-like [Trichogramma pretiosum]|uniref:zinc finger protein 582-like n=1 Tax=Trichogramma pretiosum TaxID=7493 RepID=UPI0006C988E7|nr:zinc finger protein 582-like [Trichogramma pretiosum]
MIKKSRMDINRVKNEPIGILPSADDDYNFDLVNSSEDKNFETFTYTASHTYQDMKIQENTDEKKTVDFECKNVKVVPTSLSTVIFKSEHQNCQPVVKIENQNRTNYLNESIFIDFECKDVKIEAKSLSTTICQTEDQSYPSIVKIKNQIDINCLNNTDSLILMDTKHERRETYKSKTHGDLLRCQNKLKNYADKIQDRSKLLKCEICHKSFEQEVILESHTNAVHIRIKPFECVICQKSFRYREYLKKHIKVVHDRSKTVECQFCHKSFSGNGNLNKHINAVHECKKPFECKLKIHVNAVHNQIKSFDYQFCQESFGYKSNLNAHINVIP